MKGVFEPNEKDLPLPADDGGADHAERQSHTETVTVETAKKNLDVILEQLAPTMEYDDGTWAGTLALDHTSINTQAAGYTTGSSTVTG